MTSQCVIYHWLIDMSSGSLIHQLTGEQRRLGEYQLKLLIVLIQNAGKILTREELNTLVWERRVIGNNSLPNAIHALRVALEDDGKQQRIIKTIPKKGYILEAEFCEFLRDEAGTTETTAFSPLPATLTEPVTERKAEQAPFSGLQNESREQTHFLASAREEWQKESKKESARLTQSLQKKLSRFWRWMCIAQAALLLLTLIFLLQQTTPDRTLTVQVPGTYSNIQIYTLNRGENMNKRLNTSLFAINALLMARKINMQVYFQTSATTLNYTLVLNNGCSRRQLAMNIAQFRSDDAQLNALIYRETEREINEMANCVN